MTKDSWIKAFENTRLVKMGGMCFECCDYEDMVDDMKAFISQVEKDAIEKTNKRWEYRYQGMKEKLELRYKQGYKDGKLDGYKQAHELVNLLEDK